MQRRGGGSHGPQMLSGYGFSEEGEKERNGRVLNCCFGLYGDGAGGPHTGTAPNGRRTKGRQSECPTSHPSAPRLQSLPAESGAAHCSTEIRCPLHVHGDAEVIDAFLCSLPLPPAVPNGAAPLEEDTLSRAGIWRVLQARSRRLPRHAEAAGAAGRRPAAGLGCAGRCPSATPRRSLACECLNTQRANPSPQRGQG